MVVQLAINLLGDRDEALDLSQEVFLRVFRTIHRFRGQSSLRTWIYRIAVNQARNRHRFWRRRHRADQVSLDAHVARTASSCRAARRRPIACSRRRSWPRGCSTRSTSLPFDQRTAIVLREIDGLSYEEIAFSLGVAVGTVKSRLTRARQALRLELREDEDAMKPLTCAAARRAAAGVSRRRAAGRRSDCGRRAPGRLRRLRGGARPTSTALGSLLCAQRRRAARRCRATKPPRFTPRSSAA